MNEQEYRDQVKLRTDADGIVCHKKVANPHERGASGNGLFYTSLHIINLKRQGWIKTEDIDHYLKILKSCEAGEPWLFNRSPVKTDLNSHDDYTAIAAALRELGLYFHSMALLRECKKREWVLDNERPYSPRFFKAWLGRMPAFVAHIYHCAKEEPPLFHSAVFDMSLRITGTFASQASDDSWLLGYLKAMSYKSKASDYFINKLKTKFQDKGQGIVSRVLDEDPTHPVGLAFKLI